MGSQLLDAEGIQIRKGTEPRERLHAILKRLREHDDAYYGHQEGYSGGWNTISELRIPTPAELDRKSAKAHCDACDGYGLDYASRGGAHCRTCDGSGKMDAPKARRSTDGIFASREAAGAWAEQETPKRAATAVRYRDGGKVRWLLVAWAAC